MRCARIWFLGFLCLTPALAIDCSGATYNAETKASCVNGVQDSGETDIDCGGPGCPACSKSKICAVDRDCGAALSCRASPKDTTGTRRCLATHCLDLLLDNDETDLDCGGSCWPCTSGQGCRTGADCDSLTCAGGLCSPADCSDGKLNQDESDLDCGSTLTATTCKPCAAGQKCVVDDNCESKFCKAGLCQPISCEDGRKNGDEGGADCGGSCKTRCAENSTCNVPADCTSNVCRSGLCLSPYCGDGAANGGESDVDCGGPCGSTCLPGLACQTDRDCSTAFCNGHVCGIPTCTDGIRNQDESDVDCGDLRGICPRCKATQLCMALASCESGICADGRCSERSCSDRVRNGTEGDIDCGGNCPTRCKSGQSCVEMADCESSVCTNRLCAPATCGDGVKNGSETGPDCGGSTCASRCEIGVGCVANSDCKINSCASGKCADPLCNNAMLDGTETDADCGGDRCGKCTATKRCTKDSDCVSLNCVNLLCAAETCSDRIQNGRETFTDCGGDCPLKCDANQPCLVGADCKSGVCSAGLCKAPTCDDLVKNGLETDADCGGASCSALPSPKLCAKGQGCSSDSDCRTALVCDASQGKCVDWSCTDLRKNQDETDVDCGGTFCPGCSTEKTCRAATDCKDRICTDGKCAAPSCTDQVRNSIEGDIDCGGGCPKRCKDNSLCNIGTDCESAVCSATSPQICLQPSCNDKVKNQDETDTDCGGSCTNKCADGKICKTNVDCANSPLSTCTPTGDVNVCTPPGCADHFMKGDETDVDCGGPICSPCDLGRNCKLDRDCEVIASGKCLLGACAAASCSDLVQNGAESDIDCGGSGALGYPVCKACQAGQKCGAGNDCDSGHCVGRVCQPASCLDGTQNGGEYGIDCGSVCAGQKTNPGCPDGSPCAVDDDCSGGWCDNKICKTRTCSDGVANGAEGDKDCGAICPSKPCPLGGGCKIDADCATGSTCSECEGKCIKVAKYCYVNPAADSRCYQCATGQACSNDTDCQSLHCDSTGHCGTVDSCIGGLLNDADGNFSDGSAICASTERDRCYAFLRCLFANNCTPSDPCFTPPTDTNTPCGYNAGIGSKTGYDDAVKTWNKASCKAPTNP